jgi:ferredoxin-NADP reductase
MPVFEIETPVSEIIERTYNVKSFRFASPTDASYKPGQYLFITVNSHRTGLTKPLSISSSPTEKGFIEFTKKLTDSEFSRVLKEMKIGEQIKVKFPLGSFTFTGEYEKIAFLSGGIGITPAMSIIKYATDMKLKSSIVAIDSNSRIEDIVFKRELDLMLKENTNLRVIYTLTDSNRDLSNWQGCRGYVTRDTIKTNIPDYMERRFYLCGPPLMVDAMTKLLMDEINIKKENIILENFFGY